MNRFSRLRIAHLGVTAVVTVLLLAAFAAVGAGISPAGTSGPAAEGAYPKKITICHRTKSKKNPYVTIRISRRALKAHLRHGDGMGPCPRAIFTMCHKTKQGKKVTIKVRGAKAHRKHLKKGDKIRACKKAKPKKKNR
jgi:hypothetical protein